MDEATELSRFRRTSVADQALIVLRRAIQNGVLTDPLPGENQLARDLGISRPSLRTALARLAEEGLILRRNGRRARIQFKGRVPSARRAPPSVHLLCPISRESFSVDEHPVLLHLQTYLATKGIGWTNTFNSRLGGRDSARLLRSLVDASVNSCWLLVLGKPELHDWFARASVPALVLGSTHPGIDLPSLDTDYHAVGWHAAGNLARHGHRQVAVLAPEGLGGGDLDSSRGLVDYFARKAPDARVSHVSISKDQSDLVPKLDRLMRERQRPTALFCIQLSYTLAAMVSLLRAGWRIPRDISLVSRDSSGLMDMSLPEITRYRTSTTAMADRAAKLVQAALAGHRISTRPALIMPTFIPGGTLAAAPRQTELRKKKGEK